MEFEGFFYYIIISIITYFIMTKYSYVDFSDDGRYVTFNKSYGVALVIFVIILIGLMPITGFYTADRGNYVSWYILYVGKEFSFNWSSANYLFENAYRYVACHDFPPSYLFLPLSTIYFVCMFWACNKFFPKDGFLAFVVYLGAFSTYSYGVNGAKAGAAASLFLLAIAFHNDKKKAALFCFLSLGFHHSMLVPILVFVITHFVKNRSIYLYAWLVSCVFAALGITTIQEFFANYSNEKGASYLAVSDSIRSVSGFRPDFILYSAVPIYLGYYFHKKFNIKSDTYDFLLNLYTGTNAIFILCSHGIFINRIAYLSWLIYPVVLIYPFLNCYLGINHNRFLLYTVLGHLSFTIFMFFVI